VKLDLLQGFPGVVKFHGVMYIYTDMYVYILHVYNNIFKLLGRLNFRQYYIIIIIIIIGISVYTAKLTWINV